MRKITVCDVCLCATCWQGEFMCQDAQGAGTIDISEESAIALGREHVSYIKKYSYEEIGHDPRRDS